ncbi:MFS transporter [Ruminococcaceae bacterium OttesenSCG-928-D13]|nr:MFS transporter [Ruminococcaceae bacterium OttesenSCG-928-D13]
MATLFLLLIYLTFVSLGLPDSLLGSAWPVMRIDLGAGLDQAGLISVLVTIGTVLSSLMCEKVVKRFGTGKVTTVSVLATAAALLFASFGSSLPWLMVAAVPLGLGGGAVDAALNNYVALHYKSRHMNWLHCFWGVGAFIGPLVMSAFLSQGGNWRGGYRSIGFVQLGISALLILSLPLWKTMNTGSADEKAAEGAEAEALPGGAPPEAVNALRLPGVKSAMATFTLYCAAEYVVGLWGASFLVESRHFTEAGAASAVSFFYIGIAAGRFLAGIISSKVSSKALIRLGILVVSGASLLLLLPVGGALPPAALLLLGLGCAPIYPAMIHETPARFGAAYSQKIIGWQMASAYLGSTLVPPVMGFIAARAGLGVLPVCLCIFGAGMLLCSEHINRVAGNSKRP